MVLGRAFHPWPRGFDSPRPLHYLYHKSSTRYDFIFKLTFMLDRICIKCYVRIMNRLSTEKRAQIIGCLVEGNSIRATVRITGAAKNTVSKLLVDMAAYAQNT